MPNLPELDFEDAKSISEGLYGDQSTLCKDVLRKLLEGDSDASTKTLSEWVERNLRECKKFDGFSDPQKKLASAIQLMVKGTVNNLSLIHI